MIRTSRFLFALFFLTACGRTVPLEVPNPVPDYPTKAAARANDFFRGDAEYARNACFGRGTDGDPVPARLSSRPGHAHFGKAIDQARFDAVLSTSPAATIEVVAAQGATVFQVPLRAGECALFAPLTEVPDPLWPIWSTANVSVGGSLLALFLPAERVRAQGYGAPVIMIRSDSDRYTLVHEYVHFLFDRARGPEGRDDARLLARFEAASSRLSALLPLREDEANPARLIEVSAAWVDVAEATLPLLDGFPLEEMAVEAMLGDAYRGGRLKHVSDYSRRNGDRYIRANWNRARELLGKLSEQAALLHGKLRAAGETAWTARIDALTAQIDRRDDEGEAIAATAPSSASSRVLAAARTPGPAGAGCGRSAGITERLVLPAF